MDLTPYVDNLRRELAQAAEAGGKDARALAERLTGALDAAVRLALLEALADAANEITRDLAPGSVDVRLRGRDPDFVVTPPPGRPLGDAAEGGSESGPETGSEDGSVPASWAAPPPQAEPDDGGTTRITLRLPENLKPRVDEAAGRAGLSVNAWLVRAVTAALDGDAGRRPPRDPGPRPGRRYTGWVR